MQHPILHAHDGGEGNDDIEAWEAQFTTDLAVILSRYLADRPAPAGSGLARDAQAWAANLQRSGQVRLEALGAQRLRAV